MYNLTQSFPSLRLSALTLRMSALKACSKRPGVATMKPLFGSKVNRGGDEWFFHWGEQSGQQCCSWSIHRHESERGARKGVREAECLLKGGEASSQWCQPQVYLYYCTGFLYFFFFWVGVHQPDVWHICIIRLKWHVSWQDELWTQRSLLAHCLPLSVRRFTSWLQTRLQLGSGGLSLAVGVKKRTRDLSGGVPLCFRGTESKLGWEAEVGSLWSAHRQHERSHLPFCSLVYR